MSYGVLVVVSIRARRGGVPYVEMDANEGEHKIMQMHKYSAQTGDVMHSHIS